MLRKKSSDEWRQWVCLIFLLRKSLLIRELHWFNNSKRKDKKYHKEVKEKFCFSLFSSWMKDSVEEVNQEKENRFESKENQNFLNGVIHVDVIQ